MALLTGDQIAAISGAIAATADHPFDAENALMDMYQTGNGVEHDAAKVQY